MGTPVAGASISVVDLTDDVSRQLVASERVMRFSETLGDTVPAGSLIGRGDVLEIALWEAPPAVLFGTTLAGGTSTRATTSTSQSLSLPGQVVDENGLITVPFAGSIPAAGRTMAQPGRALDLHRVAQFDIAHCLAAANANVLGR